MSAENILIAQLPMVRCPHCGKEQQWDDCYEIKSGSSIDCEECEKEIHVLSVDMTIHLRLSTAPDANQRR